MSTPFAATVEEPHFSALERSARLRAGRLVPLVSSIAFAAALNALVGDFFIDDAYISFHYAENLADHGSLYYNPGEAGPPGYTNPLYVFSLAALRRASDGLLSYELLARCLGSLALAAILFPLLAAIADRRAPRRRGGTLALSAFVLGAFGLFPHLLPNFYCGLETGLFTLCLFAMLAVLSPGGPGGTAGEICFLAALAAALSLRLDGIAVVLPLLAAYAAAALRRSEPQRIARLGYAFFAAGLVYLLHLAIAGAYVPLSFYQKRADFTHQTFWSYASFCLLATAPLAVIAYRRRTASFTALIILGSLYISLFYSFFAHWMFQRYVFPFALASFAVLLLSVLRLDPGKRRGREVALVGLYVLAAFPPLALAGYSWVSGYRVATLNAKRIAAAMNAAELPAAQRTVAAQDSGYVAFATDWRLLDLLGLTTPEILADGVGPALERFGPTLVIASAPNGRPGKPGGVPLPSGYRLVAHLPLTNRYWWPQVDYGYSLFVNGNADAAFIRRLQEVSVDVEREMGWQRYVFKLLSRLATIGV